MATLYLVDGRVFVSGGLTFSNRLSLAVVGGTGAMPTLVGP